MQPDFRAKATEQEIEDLYFAIISDHCFRSILTTLHISVSIDFFLIRTNYLPWKGTRLML